MLFLFHSTSSLPAALFYITFQYSCEKRNTAEGSSSMGDGSTGPLGLLDTDSLPLLSNISIGSTLDFKFEGCLFEPHYGKSCVKILL